VVGLTSGDAENAGLENAGLENAGTSCVWVAKCNIINVRGHVRVNVTAGRGDPRYRVHCRRQFKAATETYEIQLCRSQPYKLSLRSTDHSRNDSSPGKYRKSVSCLSCGHQHGFSSVSAFDV